MELTGYPDNAAMRSDVLTDLVGGEVAIGGTQGRGYDKRGVKPLSRLDLTWVFAPMSHLCRV
jgi:hypothetical protein